MARAKSCLRLEAQLKCFIFDSGANRESRTVEAIPPCEEIGEALRSAMESLRRRLDKVDVDSSEAEDLESALRIWQEWAEDVEKTG